MADPNQSQRFGFIHKHSDGLLSLHFLFIYSFIHFRFRADAELEGVREAGGDGLFPEHVSDLSDCTQAGHDAGLVSGAETRSGVRLVGGSQWVLR